MSPFILLKCGARWVSGTKFDPLTTRKKFADFHDFSRIYSSWCTEFNFRDISIQRYDKFSFFGFFNSACLFENISLQKLQCLKIFCMLNLDPLEFLGYLLPFKRYEWKQLFIFNSVWPQCEAILADFRLLHVQNVEEWAVMKINQFCFFTRKLRCIAILQSGFYLHRKNTNSATSLTDETSVF